MAQYSGIAALQPGPVALSAAGGSFQLPNGQLALPVYGQGGYDATAGDYVAGPVTAYWVYDKLPVGQSYARKPYAVVDPAGNVTGSGVFPDDIGADGWLDRFVQVALVVGGGLVVGSAALATAGGGAGAGGAVAATGGELAGPTLSKAALDGTTIFGANSVAGAYEISAVTAAGASSGAASAVSAAASSGGSLVSTILGGAKAALGLGASAAALAAKTSGGGAAQVWPGSTPDPQTYGATGGGNATLWIVGGAVLTAVVVVLITRKKG